MEIREAQREVRTVFMGGFVGSLVSGVLWLLSAALATWGSPKQGILTLVIGGAFLFPATQLVFAAMKRPNSLSAGNPMSQLAREAAFIIPLTLPVVGAATLGHMSWFYPACMVIVGAHYLPFGTLYGMWQYWVIAGAMIAGGTFIAMWQGAHGLFPLGGWATGVALIVFAFVVKSAAAKMDRAAS
jgi:hypothetical protein